MGDCPEYGRMFSSIYVVDARSTLSHLPVSYDNQNVFRCCQMSCGENHLGLRTTVPRVGEAPGLALPGVYVRSVSIKATDCSIPASVRADSEAERGSSCCGEGLWEVGHRQVLM